MPESGVRQKSSKLLQEALTGGSDISGESIHKLAEDIEQFIFEEHSDNDEHYKESIRSHVFNLKDDKNPLRERVLSGELDPREFAHMDTAAMATNERRRSDEQMRRSSIIDSMGIDDLQPRHRDLDSAEPRHES
ncbi:transcription factor S-II, central domain-containing protein [Radiomyces spectabilis]|uniref:transcription factor S-II, central domain-containing protein n=1 Tax=Radiomyces spectabilis TaxID=64574 RepID=UPI00221F2331|nr:transcription factor S-II, central domain-containing protein [Radiomyces spectabilis]KAI8364642.1 transcription factor S-II, central domain-containing protein [Radiomyces spectabilis]